MLVRYNLVTQKAELGVRVPRNDVCVMLLFKDHPYEGHLI